MSAALRILTARSQGNRVTNSRYTTIPLQKKYAVTKSIDGDRCFTIAAVTLDDKGKPVGWGATPSAIKTYMSDAVNGAAVISSKTGTCYVNVSEKKEEKKNGAIAGQLEAMAYTDVCVGVFVATVKMLKFGWDVAQELEVNFSITAERASDTVFNFDGEKTLSEIATILTRNKAWPAKGDAACAMALGEAVLNAYGPLPSADGSTEILGFIASALDFGSPGFAR